jgi:lipoate-protein ligase A
LKVRYSTRPIVTSNFTTLAQQVTNPSNKYQAYISQSLDPFLNLSIEHYLLQKSPPESTILFLYTNKPSIILGRNQNPWVEVNLSLIKEDTLDVWLVRRRSGGGTVFHDEGNVNYSVICPTAVFNRDKHAEMVVRALQSLGIEKARVNERHDIVVDSDGKNPRIESSLTQGLKPFKVSGSAYKLTRLRSLHHGTCLLRSPNLQKIGPFLRSPLKASIAARGVESVSSPVMNVDLSNRDFLEAVTEEFSNCYETVTPTYINYSLDEMNIAEPSKAASDILKGYNELKSPEWIYGQTPLFTYSGPEDEFTARSANVTEVKKGRMLVDQKLFSQDGVEWP